MRDKFHLFNGPFVFDNWGILPADGYQPSFDARPLGERLPEDWSPDYKNRYGQLFQPAQFYRNCALLTNMALSQPESRGLCEALFLELRRQLVRYSAVQSGARYVVNQFPFQRYGVTLEPGWSGGIMNAFAIAGLVKSLQAFALPETRILLHQYVDAFSQIQDWGVKTPGLSRWITLRDDEGFLWFEEYPLPDGTGCRVQNGHIFVIFALGLYARDVGQRDVSQLINAGLTTIKANALKFRRPGQVCRYDLKNMEGVDYAPARAIKQHSQLYALTQDNFFRGMAHILYQDMVEAGCDLPDWIWDPIERADTVSSVEYRASGE